MMLSHKTAHNQNRLAQWVAPLTLGISDWTAIFLHPVVVTTFIASWQIYMYVSYSLQSRKVERTPWDSIDEFIIQKLNPLVVVDFMHA